MATITGPLSLNDIEAALEELNALSLEECHRVFTDPGAGRTATRPVKASKTISTPNLISR